MHVCLCNSPWEAGSEEEPPSPTPRAVEVAQRGLGRIFWGPRLLEYGLEVGGGVGLWVGMYPSLRFSHPLRKGTAGKGPLLPVAKASAAPNPSAPRSPNRELTASLTAFQICLLDRYGSRSALQQIESPNF